MNSRYGNDIQDLNQKRSAFRMSIPLFREYLHTRPKGDLAQQASYQLGMALLLTGEREQAEATFNSNIHRYRTGNWVALSAYRLAAQLYNRKDWVRAALPVATLGAAPPPGRVATRNRALTDSARG